jgi:hypothetical protein
LLSLLLAVGLMASPMSVGTASAQHGFEPAANHVGDLASTDTDVDEVETEVQVEAEAEAEVEGEAEALELAAVSGTPVGVADARTSWSRVLAHPDGLLEFETSVEPRWVRGSDGSWRDVDATLEVGADGLLRPAAAVLDLEFSGGGEGPLATMREDGKELSLSWPLGSLPTPIVSGDTVTYESVLPGVDLVLRALVDGFTQVLVVHDAEAAANPLLRDIAFDTAAVGVTLGVNAAGGLEAVDGEGVVVFGTPTPLMWDSQIGEGVLLEGSAEAQLLESAGESVSASAPSGAGGAAAGARVLPLPAHVEPGRLTLVADELLDDPDAVFPVFIDPPWNGSLRNGEWTMVWSNFPNSSFWKNSTALNNGSTRGTAGVGRVEDCSGCSQYRIRSFFRMNTEWFRNKGYTVVDARFRIQQRWSWTCNPSSNARVWRTNVINSSHTWNNQPGWLSEQDTRAANRAYQSAHGCQSPGTLSFNVTSATKSAVDANNYSVTFGMRAIDEGTVNQWKRYDHTTAVLRVVVEPRQPTNVKVSTDCVPSCTSPATVRATRPFLQARVSDPLGGQVTAEFQLRNYVTGDIITTGTDTVPSGSDASWRTPTLVNGTQYRFRVRAKNDSGFTGSWSSYFRFTINTSGPSTPTSVGVSSTTDCWQSCSSPAVLRAARPTFRATPQHPFGDVTDVVFEIHPQGQTSVQQTATLTNRVAGQQQTWRPPTNLPQGDWRLRVRSVNDNYSRNGSWSSWFLFTVDTVAPNTPLVSSTDYPHKDTSTWNGGVGIAGQFHLSPNGSDDVTRYEWRWNGGGTIGGVNVSKGGATSPHLTPPGDLLQVLEVRTIDHAGWTSAWRSYEFRVRPQPVDRAYWKFDETTGSQTFTTVGGSQYAGLLSSGATFVPSLISEFFPEASGNAVSLDGSSGYVQMPTVLETDHIAGFTISAWSRPTSLSGSHTVVAQNGTHTFMARIVYLQSVNGGLGGWCLQVRDSDSLAAPVTQVCSPADQVILGEWQFLAAVFDQPAGVLRLYVDAGFNNMEWPPGWEGEIAAPTAWSANGDFLVGRSESGDYWHGLIDEVRAYQRVVPEAELVDYFSSCRYGVCEPMT